MTTTAPNRRPKTPKLALFKLERGKGHRSDTGYDQTNSYIIAAENENEARDIAAQNEYSSETCEIWYDATITPCEKIAKGSKFTEPDVVCRDFNAG
jgi:hypothetical protein